MGHCQQAPGRKTTMTYCGPFAHTLCYQFFRSNFLHDANLNLAWFSKRERNHQISSCMNHCFVLLFWKMWLIHADPKSQPEEFRLAWCGNAAQGIWSRALKDLAYQRPWRTASGSNLDIKRDNTVATCCRRNFPVVSCFLESFPTSTLGRRKHVAQTLWMPWPKKSSAKCNLMDANASLHFC